MRLSVLTLAIALAPLALANGVVEGSVVVVDDGPVPGCTVTLEAGGWSRTLISDETGRFRFEGVPSGVYDLTVALPGFDTIRQRLDVWGDTVVPPLALKMAIIAEPITINCSFRGCSDTPPATPWDVPLCDDETLNASLIAAANAGDRSAVERLRDRYETAGTHRERHRIAAALLGHGNDRQIWRDLAEEAAIVVRYPLREDGSYPPEFVTYCASREAKTDQVRNASLHALQRASRDPRARPLLLDALESGDDQLASLAAEWLNAPR